MKKNIIKGIIAAMLLLVSFYVLLAEPFGFGTDQQYLANYFAFILILVAVLVSGVIDYMMSVVKNH